MQKAPLFEPMASNSTFAKVATVFQQHLLSGRIQMTIDKPSEVIHNAKIQDDVGHTEDCQ